MIIFNFTQTHKLKSLFVLLFVSLLISSCRDKSPTGPEIPTPSVISQLHVDGKYIKTSKGTAVRLTGVNIPSLEWSNEGEHLTQSIQVAIKNWEANVIRLPLCQDRWFGKADGQSDSGKSYQTIVDMAIKQTNSLGAYAVIDLHWSDAGAWGKYLGQHKMPDNNSITFWKVIAKKYSNNPGVLFDLYNEPHDVDWNIWKLGGQVNENIDGINITYNSVGLQEIIDSIRSVGAKNIIIVSGLDWGYDLTGVLTGYSLNDPNGNGIIYSSHIYPWKGSDFITWDLHVGLISKYYPVFIGEVGCKPAPTQVDPNIWAPEILQYINLRGLSWAAWSFHPSASPCLISDWNYNPTSYWGVYVKDALLKNKTNTVALKLE